PGSASGFRTPPSPPTRYHQTLVPKRAAYKPRHTEVQIEFFPMQSGPVRHNFHGGHISCGRALKTLKQMDWDDECGSVGQLYDKPFGFSIVPRSPRPRLSSFGFFAS